MCVCSGPGAEARKTPDPLSGVGAYIRELLTVPASDPSHNARDSSAEEENKQKVGGVCLF